MALDDGFEFVGELVAVRAEDFHAVVLVRVVRGGEHDAGCGAHGLGEVGDGGRGERADHEDVHAHRNEAAGEGGFEHVAGNAGVFADENAVAVRSGSTQHLGHGFAHPQGDFGSDGKFVHAATNAVGSK